MFLLVSGFVFGQQIARYQITISNLNYRINKGVKRSSNDSKIRITVNFESGPSKVVYLRRITNEGDNETNLNFSPFYSSVKPISVDCYAFVNFRTGTDANGTVSKDLKTFCPSGTLDGNFSPRMTHVTFNYKVEPEFEVKRLEDDILPTETKKTMIATSGYDLQYYRWQYTLLPNGTATQWQDLPQYNNSPSITVNAVDILGANAGLNIGKNIYFRIKPCIETPGLSTSAAYTIRLSAPKVNSFTSVQPKCVDSNDGSVQLVFNRTLLNGEQLNYTLLDIDTNTPSNYNNVLVIDANKTFNISGLQAGTYTLQLIGFKDGLNTSVDPSLDPDLFALTTFTIKSPPPLDFKLSSTNIQCNGAQDGTITIRPTGGTRSVLGNDYYSLNNGAWISFPNDKPYTLASLALGTYKIKVKDMNGCVASEQKIVGGKIRLEDEIINEETISQPDPLKVEYSDLVHPTFFSARNGKLVAVVSGGTIDVDHYWYQWKHNSGAEYPTTAKYDSATKKYTIILNNVPAGEYKLTIRDKNYDAAVNKAGCSIIESSQVLTEPKAIKITLEETQPISCNTANVDAVTGDPNKLSDGIIKATVSGGVKFTGSANNGLPYKFIWSKYNTVTSLWEELTDQNTDTAQSLSQGRYSLNVIDQNGITQGTYNTIELIKAIPTELTIVEPNALLLTFDSGNVSCHEGNNGWAIANVTNGKAPYKYKWFGVGEGVIDENKISQLKKGEYFVEITDAKGCFTKGSIIITEPLTAVDLKYIENETVSPTFHGATNGKIVVEVTGGTPNTIGNAYSYKWVNKKGDIQVATTQTINGIFTITLDGLPADDYFLTVWDKNYNSATNQVVNCSIIDSKISLSEPDPLVVTFEIKQTISCNVSNEFGNDKDITPKDGQRDESQDGILIAHVKGGTPLTPSANNGLPYYFYWKKQQADGTWITWNENDETAENLSHGNYALNIKDKNGIMLGTYVNNVLVTPIDMTQFMQEPPKLLVTITKGDVFCNGGNDGWATANVTGGTVPYQYDWSNGEIIPENTFLSAGSYLVKSIDARGCAIQESIKIKEPLEPITLNYTEVTNPSFYKATNGKIVVDVKGGTIFPDNSYWYEWKNSKGIILTTTTGQFSNGIYTITLNGVPEDTYTLTIRDSNYNLATNKIGCTIINSQKALDDPDPLEVTFEVVRTISCNVNNEFGNETDASPLDNQRDESQDGILVAHVTGGIQLKADKNNGLSYFYTWKKQQKDGSWTIWDNQDETAENISHGTYALNIEDANGIKLGTYVNNILTKEIDVIQFMPEPPKLGLTFTKLDVGCTTGNDGWAEAFVTGGTTPYAYKWTNEATTARIDNLTTNNYFAIVTDAEGCTIQGSIFVGDPNGIFTTETTKNPTCFQGNDGYINLDVTGGNLPYQYHWNTDATTKDISNLAAGSYEVAITCPDCCVYKKNFTLKDPEPIVINLGPDRTLCNDQSLDLDASIADSNAQYSWTATNGFKSNSPTVNLTKAGTYHVKVTSGLGCIGEDSIEITTNKVAISSEFLLSSQAYLDEEVILVNTSEPFGENTQWIIPNGAVIVDQKEKFITLKFNAIGTYNIGLKQTQGDCYAVYSKNIKVEQRTALPNVDAKNSKFITDFILTPNPSDGNFKAIINMEESGPVNLRLFSYNGQYSLIQKKESGKKNYSIDFNAKLAAGVYVIVLETAQQTLVKKIIIN